MMPRDFEWYLLRWLLFVGYLVDGFFGFFTAGFWSPDSRLSAEAHFLDHAEKLQRKGNDDAGQ